MEIDVHAEKDLAGPSIPTPELYVPEAGAVVPADASVVRPMVVGGVAQCHSPSGAAGGVVPLYADGVKLYEGFGEQYVWHDYPSSPAFDVELISDAYGYIMFCVQLGDRFVQSCNVYPWPGWGQSYSTKYGEYDETSFFSLSNPTVILPSNLPSLVVKADGYGYNARRISVPAGNFPSGKKIPVMTASDVDKYVVNVGLKTTYASSSGSYYTTRVNNDFYVCGASSNKYYSSVTHSTGSDCLFLSSISTMRGMCKVLVSPGSWYSSGTTILRADTSPKHGGISFRTSFGSYDVEVDGIPESSLGAPIGMPGYVFNPWHQFEFHVDLAAKTVDLVVTDRSVAVLSTDVNSWKYG